MYIKYVTLDKKRYPMCFSLHTMKTLSSAFGSMDKALKVLQKGKNITAEKLDIVAKMAAAMIETGCEYMNFYGKNTYNGAPVDENGRFIPISYKDLLFLEDIDDINGLTTAVFECINKSQTKQIHAKPKGDQKKRRSPAMQRPTSKRKRG